LSSQTFLSLTNYIEKEPQDLLWHKYIFLVCLFWCYKYWCCSL